MRCAALWFAEGAFLTHPKIGRDPAAALACPPARHRGHYGLNHRPAAPEWGGSLAAGSVAKSRCTGWNESSRLGEMGLRYFDEIRVAWRPLLAAMLGLATGNSIVGW